MCGIQYEVDIFSLSKNTKRREKSTTRISWRFTSLMMSTEVFLTRTAKMTQSVMWCKKEFDINLLTALTDSFNKTMVTEYQVRSDQNGAPA